MKDTNDYGAKIREFRKRMQVSQFDLEIEAGLSNGTVSRLERGRINPTKETLSKIASHLKLDCYDTAYLFGIDLARKVNKLSN